MSMKEDVYYRTLTAARAGNPIAQYNIGCHYHQGRSVPKDLAMAAQWWLKAAEQDFPPAQYALGFICFDQIGEDEALKWTRAAANNGHQYAQAFVGSMYFWGGPLVDRDRILALKWMILATKNNTRFAPRIFCKIMKIVMTSEQVAASERLAEDWIEWVKVSSIKRGQEEFVSHTNAYSN